MKRTDFSRHTIADLRDWNELDRVEIQPDFQRKYVWSEPAKVMLIDSILLDIPLPKIFIASKILEGNTHRIVIDGQQRITTILDFVHDKFSLKPPYQGEFENRKFSELPERVQTSFLSYRLDFNEFENYSEEDMRGIYNRVNKYTAALTKQELRRADFPGDFLKAVEEIALDDFFEESKIFTTANRRRMADVEFISELMALVIGGIQDKKTKLDDFYLNYANWDNSDMESVKSHFRSILSDMARIFSSESLIISKTRFKQKSDFYSLFSAINTLKKNGKSLNEECLPYLVEDLKIIDNNVYPGEANLFGEYATRCLSDANSRASRLWRTDFFLMFLGSAYSYEENIAQKLEAFYSIKDSFLDDDEPSCKYCSNSIMEDNQDWDLIYPEGKIFLSLAKYAHKNCMA